MSDCCQERSKLLRASLYRLSVVSNEPDRKSYVQLHPDICTRLVIGCDG